MSCLPAAVSKTITFSYIASRVRQNGKRIGIFAHRSELIGQISRTLKLFDVPHGLITAGSTYIPNQSVYVCSVQTYARRVATGRAPVFDMGIVDEAHHASEGSTWDRCMANSPDAIWLGVTATPERLDARPLEAFQVMLKGPTPRQLIDAGALCDYRLFAPTTIDLSGVHTIAGDYNKGELADAVDRPSVTGDAVRHYAQYLKGAPSVAFCVSVAHAEHVAEQFRAAGYKAASVDGKMSADDRAKVIGEFSAGKLNVLSSCDLISEGFDVPGIHGAILLRPTQSLSLYLQQVGRALRTAPGKDRAIILDHAGNCGRHGLPDQDREWSLEGRKKSKGTPNDVQPVRQCERCFCAYPANRGACPECGWVPAPAPRQVEQVDGELTEVNTEEVRRVSPILAAQSKARDLDALLRLGHSESRAKHILAARAEKDQLRETLRSLGPPMTMHDIRQLKPKQLREWIDKLTPKDATNEDVRAARV